MQYFGHFLFSLEIQSTSRNKQFCKIAILLDLGLGRYNLLKTPLVCEIPISDNL